MKTQLLVCVAAMLTLVGCASTPQKAARSSGPVATITSCKEILVSPTPIALNSAEARRLESEGWRPVWARNNIAWVGGADVPASDKSRLEYERDVPPPVPALEPTAGPLAVWSLATMPNRGLAWGAY